MNLINKEVSHKKFGKGRIVKLNESSVEVNFGSETKKFIFPDAFGKFLKLHDQETIRSMKKFIQKRELEKKQEKLKLMEEKERRRKEKQLYLEHQKLLKNKKLHPKSQTVFWCNEEEHNQVFREWRVFPGVIKSGKNKGTPRRLSRLRPNSACLLTAREANIPEKDRRIIGVFMVKEDFTGKTSEDGYIPAHPEYRIKLNGEEAEKMPFWKYYINEKYPHQMTWNSGKFRYFDNVWMAQILLDIISLKKDPEEKKRALQFFEHFCEMNQMDRNEIPKPNGALCFKEKSDRNDNTNP